MGASLVLSLSLPAALTSPAAANEVPSPGTTGGTNGQDLTAGVSSIRFEPATPPPGAALTATTGWTPPACWLEPQYTAEQLKVEREHTWGLGSTGDAWEQQERDFYVNGHPHTDFEIPNSDKGLWWNGVANPNRKADPASLKCFQEHSAWVLKGTIPDVGIAVTPEILAKAAYDRIRVPDTDVSLSPAAGSQKVNLNTWVWLDKADFKPVSVTARLPALGLWATTTATPIGLHLEAGTSDADLYPASGDCGINKDGSIGTPYKTGDNGVAPPCGVTYRRASTGGAYPLKATVTWKVEWRGSGNTGDVLPSGTFDRTTPVTVQEIQAVVR
ncbi:hypothetical protein QMK19_22400 [Streptomyces sp. H10-C2]|uniref:hypothetical protein n=1 Tax=unclassified Streptomyces TaxID=2593676 RepID=UPI0024BA71C2|nr:MULTISPECIES: hypothetical protein [unclassified Streptomyces]MDJ0342488.1 hypothetical protein [Streptomyces sp. PH10-H1]MDJ0372343.1 hypothetical protein [Streptomyces sp. H10-C2]